MLHGIHVEVKVNGIPIHMELDKGVSVTIISERTCMASKNGRSTIAKVRHIAEATEGARGGTSTSHVQHTTSATTYSGR